MSGDQVPVHRVRPLAYVPGEMYGTLVSSAMSLLDGGSEYAEQVVDKILAPLGLIPPLPEVPQGITCDRVFFSAEGTWHFCNEKHPDLSDREDLQSHSDDTKSWCDEPFERRQSLRR